MTWHIAVNFLFHRQNGCLKKQLPSDFTFWRTKPLLNKSWSNLLSSKIVVFFLFFFFLSALFFSNFHKSKKKLSIIFTVLIFTMCQMFCWLFQNCMWSIKLRGQRILAPFLALSFCCCFFLAGFCYITFFETCMLFCFSEFSLLIELFHCSFKKPSSWSLFCSFFRQIVRTFWIRRINVICCWFVTSFTIILLLR